MNAYNLTNSERMPFYCGSGIFNRKANREGFGSGCTTGYTNLHPDCGDEEIFGAFGETPVAFGDLDLNEAWEDASRQAYMSVYATWRSEVDLRRKPMEQPSTWISDIQGWLLHEGGAEGVTAEEVEKAEAELEALKEKLEELEEEYKAWLEENPAPGYGYELPLDTRIEIIHTALIAELEANHPNWLDEVENGEVDEDEDEEDGEEV
jgi:hypothetical protein